MKLIEQVNQMHYQGVSEDAILKFMRDNKMQRAEIGGRIYDPVVSGFDKLYQQAALGKIREGIIKRGYECVTFISDKNGERDPYHYTVGLSEMGFAEIFISGRLPQETAYALIGNMVDLWKKEKGVTLGKFGPFARFIERVAYKMVSRKATLVGHFPSLAHQRNGAPIPLEVVWVDTKPQRQKEPAFMGLLYEFYPNTPSILVVQVIWPDENMRLPSSGKYNTSEEYKQELLPVKS